MHIEKIEQGSTEWHEVRRGKFTASMFAKLMSSKTTKGYSDLLNQVVFERLTQKSVDQGYVNEDMLRGTELEPVARADYEFDTGSKVEEIGFVTLNEWAGCSPDGLVGEDGMLEIKCPKWSTHIDYLLKGGLPSQYKWQVHGQLYVTGRKWVDFYSYHPDLDAFLHREERNEELIEQLALRLQESIKEVEVRLRKLGAK